jgi:hypothetical protein
MGARRFDRFSWAQFLTAECALVTGVLFLIGPAHGQFPVSVPNPPTQMMGPSTPDALPQRRSAAVSALAPTVLLRRTVSRTAARSIHEQSRSTMMGPIPANSSYGCAWRRSPDGYWSRTPPCS